MLWIGTAATLVAGIVAMAVTFAKRPADVDELGSMSNQWIAEHRVDSRSIPRQRFRRSS